MPDEQRAITDAMLLSELTVGEFKALMQAILPTLYYSHMSQLVCRMS
jgi:hypothetical protein